MPGPLRCSEQKGFLRWNWESTKTSRGQKKTEDSHVRGFLGMAGVESQQPTSRYVILIGTMGFNFLSSTRGIIIVRGTRQTMRQKCHQKRSEMMTILEKVCNNYSGDLELGSVFYELIRRDDGSFAVLWLNQNSGGWPVLDGSHRIETEEEARQAWERAKAEMKRRWGMCVPWTETMRGREENER